MKRIAIVAFVVFFGALGSLSAQENQNVIKETKVVKTTIESSDAETVITEEIKNEEKSILTVDGTGEMNQNSEDVQVEKSVETTIKTKAKDDEDEVRIEFY